MLDIYADVCGSCRLYTYIYIFIHTEMCIYIWSADHTPLYIGGNKSSNPYLAGSMLIHWRVFLYIYIVNSHRCLLYQLTNIYIYSAYSTIYDIFIYELCCPSCSCCTAYLRSLHPYEDEADNCFTLGWPGLPQKNMDAECVMVKHGLFVWLIKSWWIILVFDFFELQMVGSPHLC